MLDPLLEAADKVLELVRRLRAAGIADPHLDLGGGLGVPYRPGDRAASIASFLDTLRAARSNALRCLN